jgi:hypothetical protein
MLSLARKGCNRKIWEARDLHGGPGAIKRLKASQRVLGNHLKAKNPKPSASSETFGTQRTGK